MLEVPPMADIHLKRDHHDLFDRVIAGELSANAAAIEAGDRIPGISADVLPGRLRAASICRAAFATLPS